jgi:hypothetical protein
MAWDPWNQRWKTDVSGDGWRCQMTLPASSINSLQFSSSRVMTSQIYADLAVSVESWANFQFQRFQFLPMAKFEQFSTKRNAVIFT